MKKSKYEKRPLTLTSHYKGLCLSMFHIKHEREHIDFVTNLMEDGLRNENMSLKRQSELFYAFLETVYRRKKEGKKIRRQDHLTCLQSLSGLMKMNIIKEDDKNGFIITKRLFKPG